VEVGGELDVEVEVCWRERERQSFLRVYKSVEEVARVVNEGRDKDLGTLTISRVRGRVDLTVSACGGASWSKIEIRLALAKSRRRTVSVG
jgi:hypothetical protein